ncbi:MAG: hypothetical protein JXR78_02995 [Victivallales bacterium]|nr:hypothetical protein [Victivallales bacterium]
MTEFDEHKRDSVDSWDNSSAELDPELKFRLKQAEVELLGRIDDNRVFTPKRIIALAVPLLILVILTAAAYFLSKLFGSPGMR